MNKLSLHKLSDLYEISSGISSSPSQAGHGSPFISFKTVFDNYFLPEEISELMFTSVNEQRIFSVKEGDIFLTRTSETLNELGMSAVAYRDYPNATFSGFLKRLRPLPSGITYHKYMAFYLRSKLFRKTMTNNAIMTLRASFNEQIFSYLNLLLPPFDDQKRIGDFLFLLYKKNELNNRIILELDNLTKLLFDYWFVQFEFPDSKGNPYKSSGGKMVYNEALKRDIPDDWEVIEIQTLLKKNVGSKKISAKNYNITGSIPIIDQSTDFIAGYTDDSNYQTIISEEPAIIFGDHTRILKLINFNFARGADGTQVLFSNNDRMPQYLFYYTLNKIDLSNRGYARHFKFLKETKIILPSKAISTFFDNKVKEFYSKILSCQKQNRELSKLRDWLMPMFINGQAKIVNEEHGNSGGVSKQYDNDHSQDSIGKLEFQSNKTAFAKQILAGQIVSEFINDPNFTEIKFQKIQFLAEHICEVDLSLNYYYQAAGPYDNRFMHTIYKDFQKQKWFKFENKHFMPLEKYEKIKDYYQSYFSLVQEQLANLFELLYPKSEAEAEIVATVYAVWNNRLIGKQEVNDQTIIDGFYQWSDRKRRYSFEQVNDGIQFLKDYKLEPKGFGKLIKMAKLKN